MNGWIHVQKHLLRALLVTAAALGSASGLRADLLTSNAPPAAGPEAVASPGFMPLGAAPVAHRGRSTPDAKGLLHAVRASLVQLQEELVRELVAMQVTMIGGHPLSPPKTTATPPPPPPPVTTENPPPPPPPPTGGGQPPIDLPPPPPPPPPTQSPEPASLVTALLGVGLASLAAWRQHRRKQTAAPADDTPRI
jgi:hypothetical protein